MNDPVVADLIVRVTRLEAANDVNLSQVLQRLQRLEEAGEQTRINTEQAERAEMAAVRQKLAAAEAQIAGSSNAGSA